MLEKNTWCTSTICINLYANNDFILYYIYIQTFVNIHSNITMERHSGCKISGCVRKALFHLAVNAVPIMVQWIDYINDFKSRINISVLDIQFDRWPISLSLDCWDGPSEEYLNHQSSRKVKWHHWTSSLQASVFLFPQSAAKLCISFRNRPESLRHIEISIHSILNAEANPEKWNGFNIFT